MIVPWYSKIHACTVRVISRMGLMMVVLIAGICTCAKQDQWYVNVYFMSEGYVHEEVEYNPGDYINIEAHTPIVFEFPQTIELYVSTNEGDQEIVVANWIDDVTEPDYYVHRGSIKMVAPENPVKYSNFIETHCGAVIVVVYDYPEYPAIDTAYVVKQN